MSITDCFLKELILWMASCSIGTHVVINFIEIIIGSIVGVHSQDCLRLWIE